MYKKKKTNTYEPRRPAMSDRRERAVPDEWRRINNYNESQSNQTVPACGDQTPPSAASRRVAGVKHSTVAIAPRSREKRLTSCSFTLLPRSY